MQVQFPKKTAMLAILEVLKKHSDENNRLSQEDIRRLVQEEYSIVIDRKRVARHLEVLLEMDYGIEYDTKERKLQNGDFTYERSNWYIVREFSDAELRLLVDSLFSSKHIPNNHRLELIKKLENLSNRNFSSKVKHIRVLPQNLPENKQLFLTIDVLDEAITSGKKVMFNCVYYGTDKKLHPVKTADGRKKEYKVSPYQMAVQNGRYYLICCHDDNDRLYHYRLSIISNIKVLDEPSRPFAEVGKGKRKVDLPAYLSERAHMFAGEPASVTFRADRSILAAIFEWFGLGARFLEESDDYVTANVSSNESDILYWALQYGKHVEILKPESLRDRVKEAVRVMWEKYHSED